jgi:restriction system protein
MTITDAAFQVLTEAGQPMHYREIARQIQDRGLWSATGMTPENSVKAALYTDVNRDVEASRFRFAGAGMFALQHEEEAPAVAVPQWPAARFDPPTLGSMPLSFPNAAERVLQQFGEGKPMHYESITCKALALGLIAPKGRTPEATMRGSIQQEVEACERAGRPVRFVRHGKGMVSLVEGVG